MPRLSRKLSPRCKMKVLPLSASVIPFALIFCEPDPTSVASTGGEGRIAGQLQMIGGTPRPPLWVCVGVTISVGHAHTVTGVPETITEVMGGSLVTEIGMRFSVICGTTVGWGAQAVIHNRIGTVNESFIIKFPLVGLMLI